jgi:hypothetical protein
MGLLENRVKRIIDCYKRSTSLDRAQGESWYQRAFDYAQHIHPNAMTGAGVIAALSPNLRWSVNQDAAKLMCDAALNGDQMPDAPGYPLNRVKAWRIANGDYQFSPLELLSQSPGHFKVNNFFRNIMGDSHVVTVDRWAARIADGAEHLDSVSGKTYIGIERAYQYAANEIRSVTPRDLQAITWVANRESAE